MEAEGIRRAATGDGAADRSLRGLYALQGAEGAAFLPFYVLLLSARGLGADQVGIVLALGSIASVAIAPFWGHAGDVRLGTVRTLQIACLATAAAALLLVPAGSSFLAIAAVGTFLGAMQSPHSALTNALTLRELGPERVTEFGAFRLWASIGWGVAIIAFGALLERTGVGLAPYLYVPGLIALAIYVRRFPGLPPDAVQEVISRFGAVGDALRTAPTLVLYLSGVLLVSIATHATWDFVPLRIADGGGGPYLVGLAGGISAFIEIPFMRGSSRLIDRFGVRAVYLAGAAVYVATALAWTVWDSPSAVSLIWVATGFGFGLTYVSLVVMTERITPDHLRNSGQALLATVMWGLAPIIGTAVGGWVYANVGPERLFAGSAIGIALGALVIARAVRGLPRPARRGGAAPAA